MVFGQSECEDAGRAVDCWKTVSHSACTQTLCPPASFLDVHPSWHGAPADALPVCQQSQAVAHSHRRAAVDHRAGWGGRSVPLLSGTARGTTYSQRVWRQWRPSPPLAPASLMTLHHSHPITDDSTSQSSNHWWLYITVIQSLMTPHHSHPITDESTSQSSNHYLKLEAGFPLYFGIKIQALLKDFQGP